MNRIKRLLVAVWGATRIILLVTSVSVVAVVGVVSMAAVELRGANVLGTLTITLFTAVGVILASAFVATAVPLWLHQQTPVESRPADPKIAEAFERYVTKFALLIGPITAGYGLIRAFEAIN